MRWTRLLRTAAAVALVTTAAAIAPAPTPAHALTPTINARRVGVSLYGSVLSWSPTKLTQQLDLVQHTGAVWVRVPMDWATLQMHGRGTYNWAPADRVITEAKRRHLQVMPDIAYTPAWARHNAGRPTDPPSSPIYFGQFMAAMTKRYAPRGIHYWEIWNEPNLSTMWTPRPNATQYVALLKAAYFGIHINDSRATVVTGGLSPAVTTKDRSSIAPYEFATRMYSAGAQGLFTAFGLHPSTYPYPSTYSAAWSTFQHVAPQLYNLMAHHHDGAKKVWATEISFPTGTDPVAVSYANQGPYLVAGVRLWQHRAYGGPIFVYSITDEGTNLASHYANMGLVHYDGTLKPAYTVLRTNILGS